MPNPIPSSLPAVGWAVSFKAAGHRVGLFFAIIFEAIDEAQQMRFEARRRYPMMDE